MDSTGYSQAVIHLAWFRDDGAHHLLFGMVELRPNEFPDSAGCPPFSHRAQSGSRKYLHYRRIVMRAKDAIEWYKSAADGSPITLPGDPDHPTPGDGAPLAASRFGQEPRWPETITSAELAFAPDWTNPARVHFLVPQEPPRANIRTILRVDRNRGKLEDWLNFDIVDAFDEYQGVLCIVAPNPVFRAIDRSHLGGSDTDSAETVAYKIVVRQGQTPSGLCLTATNERVHGPLTPTVHKFNHNPITKCRFPTRIYKEGISVSHSDYGLLHWRRPAPLVRSIRMEQERLCLFDRLLASRHAGFERETHVGEGLDGMPVRHLGRLVANQPNPSERWRQSWDLLVEQRRRVQHWTRTNDSDALAPSLVLLAVGISAVSWLLSPPNSRTDAARELWRSLFDSARECWLTMTLSHSSESIEMHLQRLFCWHPMVYCELDIAQDTSETSTRCSEDYTQVLSQDLDLLGGDHLMLAICVLNASRNGATPAIMNDVLKRNSGHIGTLITQFERWQEVEREVRRRPDIVAELAELRASIATLT